MAPGVLLQFGVRLAHSGKPHDLFEGSPFDHSLWIILEYPQVNYRFSMSFAHGPLLPKSAHQAEMVPWWHPAIY
jgi:hypothetical protein